VNLLEGQVAFVTGGGDGIGLAVARRFAEHGARVMVADIRSEAVHAAAEEARGEGLELHAEVVDVRDETRVREAFAGCAERLGEPTAVVANAGVLDLAPVAEMEVSAFRRTLDVNLVGAFITAQAATRRMSAAGAQGSVTFTSSVFGLRGGPANAAYSASKFGMVGLAQCLAAELAGQAIRANAVCPGLIETAMLRETVTQKATLAGVDERVVRDKMVAGVAMGRAADVEEVADVFVWLASPLSRYVTGQAIVVDGGWTLF
jgi:NAD(P)-dependent dehydrogenase (short-subunit alcohol dehydrogenase family)